MELEIGQVIRFKRLVGKYIVTDLSLLNSDGIVGAKKLGEYLTGGTRYEPTSKVDF